MQSLNGMDGKSKYCLVYNILFQYPFTRLLLMTNCLSLSQAKLLFMPVQGSFLSGVAALIVFVLLLMLQSGVIAGSNMYL